MIIDRFVQKFGANSNPFLVGGPQHELLIYAATNDESH